MERELIRAVRAELAAAGRGATRRGRNRYSDAVIVLVYFWAVINDRPVSWACVPANWRGVRRPRHLPSQSRMSRRLRTPSVLALLDRLERRVLRQGRSPSLVHALDSKPLPVGPHSHDRHARWGRGAGGQAKGYKLHVLLDLNGTIWQWRLTPMNGDEREMARRMLKAASLVGYHLGDGNFDSSPLHDEARAHHGQLVAPRRQGVNRGLGHRYQSPGRLRCRDLLENPVSDFGRDLHKQRAVIERTFGHLASTSGLLTHLPPWARTYHRVRLWVQAKLILASLRTASRLAKASHAA